MVVISGFYLFHQFQKASPNKEREGKLMEFEASTNIIKIQCVNKAHAHRQTHPEYVWLSEGGKISRYSQPCQRKIFSKNGTHYVTFSSRIAENSASKSKENLRIWTIVLRADPLYVCNFMPNVTTWTPPGNSPRQIHLPSSDHMERPWPWSWGLRATETEHQPTTISHFQPQKKERKRAQPHRLPILGCFASTTFGPVIDLAKA